MERYQVELEDCPHDQTAVVKALRIVGKVSLSDATNIYLHASKSKRTVLVAGIERHVAEHIAKVFAEAGLVAVVKVSSVPSPMICRPQANTIYKWNKLRTLVSG